MVLGVFVFWLEQDRYQERPEHTHIKGKKSNYMVTHVAVLGPLFKP